MSKYPRKAWLKVDGRVTALVYSDDEFPIPESDHTGHPARITDPNLNGGEPYLGVLYPPDLWTFVEPELVPEEAPNEAVLVYQEDDAGDVFVSLVMTEEEAQAWRRTDGYLGYVKIGLPKGSMEY